MVQDRKQGRGGEDFVNTVRNFRFFWKVEDFLSFSVAIVFTKTTSMHWVKNAAESVFVVSAFQKPTDEHKQIFAPPCLCKAALRSHTWQIFSHGVSYRSVLNWHMFLGYASKTSSWCNLPKPDFFLSVRFVLKRRTKHGSQAVTFREIIP